MFESFYELASNPFRMSVDENYRYVHRAYKKAWSYLKYALEQAEGFVLITGRPGTGKTTLIRDILREQDIESVRAVNLATNQFQGEELLRLVALDFGFPAQDFNKATLLTRIEQHALMLHEQGQRVVIIVDEAQNLSAHGLEELRLLSNLQRGNQALFQVVLIGQEELRSLIYGQGLENIKQRIVASCRLEPMRDEHIQGYVEHRLNIAGWKGDPRLESAVYPLLHLVTHGVPREVNLVVARLLLYGSLEQKHTLRQQDLIEVLDELSKEQRLVFNKDEALAQLDAVEAKVALAVGRGESVVHDLSEVTQAEAEISDFQTLWPENDIDIGRDAVDVGADKSFQLGDVGDLDIPTEPVDDEAGNDESQSDVGLLEEGAKQEEWIPIIPTWKTESEELPALSSIFNEDYHSPPQRAENEELPPLHTIFDEDQHGPPGLYTDVDELLEHDDIQERGFPWRWLFYPVAIALFMILLLVAKPIDLGALWHQLLDVSTVLRSVETERLDDQVREPILPSVVEESEASASDMSMPAVSDNATAAPPKHEIEITQPTAPPEPAVAEIPSRSEEVSRESKPQEMAAEEVEVREIHLEKSYKLRFSRERGERGELTPNSQQTVALMAATLRAHPDTLVLITGTTQSGDKPWVEVREALRLAEWVSNQLMEKGVPQHRIIIEGSLSTHQPVGASIRLKPMPRSLDRESTDAGVVSPQSGIHTPSVQQPLD
jgi:type II secretory pathway predicted ATPase ExeA/outer membrane protein OmpA-like peptidoglycan-associated protein